MSISKLRLTPHAPNHGLHALQVLCLFTAMVIEGNRLLKKAIAEHDTWDSAGAMRNIRFTDQEASEVRRTRLA